MKKIEIIKSAWAKDASKLSESDWSRKMASGDISIENYMGYLRETYFHARENPQLQAYATAYFRNEQRELVKKFYQHAISEIGHDQMALNDLQALGTNVESIKNERPLPETIALISYGFYQVQFLNVLGYLGYLFHLEFFPTQNGHKYIDLLKSMNVKQGALSFLLEHVHVDVHHNKLMENYVEQLVKTDSDLEEVIWAAKTTCKLHGNMIDAALASGGNLFKSKAA